MKNNILHLIQKDIDNYVKNFSIYDLRARKCSTKTEYINKCLQDFNVSLTDAKFCKQRLDKAIPQADIKLSKICREFQNINWDITLFVGKYYEGGVSHTRFNTIFLPLRVFENYTDMELIRLLCHEKIHLFQRMYPEHDLIKSYMKNFIKYVPIRTFSEYSRSNPDTDGFTYKNKDGQIMCCLYRSCYPSYINDVTYLASYEHPFEQMAIEWSL